MVRPKIGGMHWMPPHKQRRHRTQKHKRKTQNHMRKHTQKRRQQGGFLPSIGEPFVAAAAKYIAPLALFGIYRFLNPIKKGKSGTRRTRRS
jgi:hypothetical protein